MFDRWRPVLLATLAWLALVGFVRTASAAEPSGNTQRAAAAFDAGVAAFDKGESAAAARHFLDADRLAPNEDALANALVAAQRSGNVELVREAAERILSRPRVKPELSSAASAALTVERTDAPIAGVTSPDPAPAPEALRPLQSGAPSAATASSQGDSAPDPAAHAWARPVFYTGVGVTAVLTGLTIWSGVDALVARGNLPGTQGQIDSVEARAHRTDALLLGTVVAAAGTAYVGLRWVKWGGDSKPVEVAAQVTPTRALVAVGGKF